MTIAVLATLWTVPVATHQDDTIRDDSFQDDGFRDDRGRATSLGLRALDRRDHPDCLPLEEAWRRSPPEPHRNTEPTDDVWAIGACSR